MFCTADVLDAVCDLWHCLDFGRGGSVVCAVGMLHVASLHQLAASFGKMLRHLGAVL